MTLTVSVSGLASPAVPSHPHGAMMVALRHSAAPTPKTDADSDTLKEANETRFAVQTSFCSVQS